MKIRRFFAKDMRSALAEVSQELGADAAILSSNKVNGGVEVVAATDYDEAMLHAQSQPDIPTELGDHRVSNNLANMPSQIEHKDRAKQPEAKDKSSHGLSALFGLSKNSSKVISTDEPSQANVEQPNIEQILQQAHRKLNSSQQTNRQEPAVPEIEQTPTTPASFPKFEWTQEPTLVAMGEELRMLRSMLQQQVSDLAWQQRKARTPLTVNLEQNLNQLGLESSIVESLVKECEPEHDYECAWQKALALLAKRINIAEDEILTYGGVIALVGPTGVGKTTTLAKLAANHVLKHGPNSVALITTDSYRVAAHEQIKTYAKLLQVPMKVAADAQQLKQAVQKFASRRLVLIDTAGMSARDERLAQQMACLARDDIHVRNHLVLSATAQSQVLNHAIELFQPFDIQSCIISKLDEAASLGEVLSTIINQRLRVSYAADGQRVPEDIRAVRGHQLVSKLVSMGRKQHSSKLNRLATGTL